MFDAVEKTQETRAAVGHAKLRASEIFGSPIDIDLLLERSRGNLSFVLSLFSEFEKTGIQSVEEIRRHVNNAEYDALAGAAHSLKGVAGIVRAESLQQLVAEIEAAGRAKAEERLASLLHELGNEMQRCLGFVSAILAAQGEG